MKPAYEILVDEKAIDERIKSRIRSISITDEVGETADQLTLEIEDRDEDIELPRTGVKIEVSVGYKGDIKSLGRFVVDEVILRPGMMTVSGKGFDSESGIKEKKTRRFKTRNVKGIVETIARDNNLKPYVSEKFGSVELKRDLFQRNISDLHTLQNLSRTYNASFKFEAGRLLFIGKDEGKTSSGKDLETIVIYRREVSDFDYKRQGRSGYKSVEAKYHDLDGGKTEKVTAGDGKPVLTLEKVFRDEGQAQAQANAVLRAKVYEQETFSFSMAGRPDIRSEFRVDAREFRKGIDGLWMVEKVTHDLTGEYKISTDLKKSVEREKKEKQDE